MLVYKCDRCGVDLVENSPWGGGLKGVKGNHFYNNEKLLDEDLAKYDLCQRCVDNAVSATSEYKNNLEIARREYQRALQMALGHIR